MKRLLGSILGVGLLLVTLTACGQKDATAAAGPQGGGGPGGGEGQAQMQLPTEMQMLLGTFKLEGTDQAVTAEQAATLLPLWQAYRTMIGDDTAASNEIQALIQQVHDSMTEDQLAAIEALGLSFEDMTSVAQEQGVSTQAREEDDSSSSASGTGGAMGGMPGGGGGGMPGGGGMMGGGDMAGGTMPADGAAEGGEAAAAPSMSSMLVDSPLLDKLVELLATRAAE